MQQSIAYVWMLSAKSNSGWYSARAGIGTAGMAPGDGSALAAIRARAVTASGGRFYIYSCVPEVRLWMRGTCADSPAPSAVPRAPAGAVRPQRYGANLCDYPWRRPALNNANGVTVWFTGLSGSGKSTIGGVVEERLRAAGWRVEVLDGDVVRKSLTKGLGFSKEDRDENIRRIGFVAHLLTRNGVIAIVAAISPYREIRDEVRARVGSFIEVFVNAPLDVCEQRDTKGLYRKARAGEIRGFTGIDDPYEPPLHPEVECRTDLESLEESASKVLAALAARGFSASPVSR